MLEKALWCASGFLTCCFDRPSWVALEESSFKPEQTNLQKHCKCQKWHNEDNEHITYSWTYSALRGHEKFLKYWNFFPWPLICKKKNKIKYFQASDIILAHVKYKFTVSDYCSFWGAAVKIKWQTTILLRCLLREPVMKHSTLFGINTHNTSRSLSAEELPFETQTVVSHQTSVLLDFSIWEMSCSQV